MEQTGQERRKNRHKKKRWNNSPNISPQEIQRNTEKQAALAAERTRVNREVSTKLLQQQTGNREALKAFRQAKHICPRCNNQIQEISSALPDRITGEPVHFDCVLQLLDEQESRAPSEKIAYIGQGRFAVVYFDNLSDTRNFSIRRIIQWESPDNPAPWRTEIAGLFSQV
jgi:hypothetical protein